MTAAHVSEHSGEGLAQTALPDPGGPITESVGTPMAHPFHPGHGGRRQHLDVVPALQPHDDAGLRNDARQPALAGPRQAVRGLGAQHAAQSLPRDPLGRKTRARPTARLTERLT